MPQPNIVWISTHDINPHLGSYVGHWPDAEQAVTPVLDRLASEGVVYTHAFATAPVCSPSRSSILTGCYPTSIGTMHHRTKAVLPPEVKLLPEYFRAAGYYTTSNPILDAQVMAPPTTFDEISGSAHWRNRPTPETPFFAAFHGITTHESQLALDDEAFLKMSSHVTAEQRHDPETVTLPPYHPDTSEFRTAWVRYLDLITEMDHSVGELLTQLEEDGLADNTIVVFWSDHGIGLPRGKRWLNETGVRIPLIIRWPASLPAGTVRSELVSLMDVAPTMLAASGLPVPEYMDGIALFDERGVAIGAPRDYVFAARDRMDEQEDTSRSVRDARYRLIRHYHPDRSPMQHCAYPDHLPTWKAFRALHATEADQLSRGEQPSQLTPLQRSLVGARKPAIELYDQRLDRYEERNLADDLEYAPVLQRLSAALDEWIIATGDQGLDDENALLEEWRPGGTPQSTANPVVHHRGSAIEVSCETPGATIGWTTMPPGPDPMPDGMRPHLKMLGVEPNHRGWRLYTDPIALNDETIYVRAWRIGFDESDEVVITPEAV